MKKAVALRYEPGKDEAPRVVAKGRGELAKKLIELAKKEGIPVVEDEALVDALIELELDTQVPRELYEAVARVLAFVLKRMD
ncbi:MAG: flagellar biosynthesis protein FlhB [Aquificae bacterium]|nr:flagellar biosynthesis protein FlhB [Aquificota bacterium]